MLPSSIPIYTFFLFTARKTKTPDLEQQLKEITRELIKEKDRCQQLLTDLKSEKRHREEAMAFCERSKEELRGRRR